MFKQLIFRDECTSGYTWFVHMLSAACTHWYANFDKSIDRLVDCLLVPHRASCNLHVCLCFAQDVVRSLAGLKRSLEVTLLQEVRLKEQACVVQRLSQVRRKEKKCPAVTRGGMTRSASAESRTKQRKPWKKEH